MTKKEVYAKLREDIQKNGGDSQFNSLKIGNDLELKLEGTISIDEPKKKKKNED